MLPINRFIVTANLHIVINILFLQLTMRHFKFQTNLQKADDFIFIHDGDRLGIYNEEDACALAYDIDEESSILHYMATESTSDVKVETVVQFVRTKSNYGFSVTVSYDTGK